jgi:dipeptidyl aminopeptidase/acylaminoacyl peptidase
VPKQTRTLLALAVSALALVLVCGASANQVSSVSGLAVTSSSSYHPYGRGSLWISSLSGQDRRALTKPLGAAELRSDYVPTWSPDGSQVAFARWTPKQLSLMVVRSDGTGLRGVAALGRRRSTRWASVYDIRWSPDGGKLAYLAHIRGGRYGTEGIYVADVDGSGTRRIALLPKKPFGFFQLFGWTADGSRVTYAFTEGEQAEIHYTGPSHLKTTTTAGADTANVVTATSIDQAAWRADGSLFYVRNCLLPYSCQLAVIDPRSGVSRPLTHFKGLPGPDYLTFMERPGGHIVYTHGRKIFEFSPNANARTVRALRCAWKHCRQFDDAVELAGITRDGRFALIEYDNFGGDQVITRDYELNLDSGALTRIHLVTAAPAEIYLP